MKRRIITAAENSREDDRLSSAIDALKDDFDYAISGLEKLQRDGATGTNNALMIAESMSASIQSQLDEIASKIGNSNE